MASFNLAELFESVADAVPDRPAVVTPDRRLSYRQLDDRATRLANHLAATGLGRGDHVGLYLLNGTEYIEAMLAAFKLGAVPVNVNYRYVERELAHLFDDADLVGVVYDSSLADRLAAVRTSLPRLRRLLVVGGEGVADPALADAVGYEEALAGASPLREFAGRSGDDLYIAYTGGTTGMPKGVMWRHEDLFFAALGGGDPLLDKGPLADPADLPGRVPDFPLVQLCTPPLMHVSAHWGALITLLGGGKVVLLSPGRFDADEAWRTVAAEGVNTVTVVGDAMARPLFDRLAEAPEGTYDLSSLFAIGSGGAILSTSTKDQIRSLLPNALVIDTFGSSETGVAGSRAAFSEGGGARFNVDERTAVLDEHLRPVEPGSGTVGRLARRGHIPIGYYKDETKTAATFVTVEGTRWVLPGDMATVEPDGSVVLLGRGSNSINTGGEKVFPEEVEAVVKGHPAVLDVLVVGVPDERWGERIVAVVELRPGAELGLEALAAHARAELAGYKVPRELVLVDRVQRGPNGKPDYPWAKRTAAAQV